MSEHRQSKPPIYAAPPPELLLADTPSALEAHIGAVRRTATGAVRDAHARAQALVGRWVGVEHAVESRLHALRAPSERLTPGALYVGIAFLAASVVARTRGLPARLILPPAAALAASHHFLPQTTANVGDYLGALEERHFPAVAEAHAVGNAHAAGAWARAREAVGKGRVRVEGGVLNAVDWAGAATGLRLREVLGRVGEVVHKAEEVVREVEADATQKVDDVVKKAESAAQETKERVV
ncbi:apolipo protein O-domain-containing protein [Mycena sp. CBHHK59/15]|nr:apolipo protein O-domain-containing protein [Mycena sp. CBHHK59/15]